MFVQLEYLGSVKVYVVGGRSGPTTIITIMNYSMEWIIMEWSVDFLVLGKQLVSMKVRK